MCNFYMMFYWDATLSDPFPNGARCFMQEKYKLVNEEYPVEGTIPLQFHLDWETEAHQSKLFGEFYCNKKRNNINESESEMKEDE